MDMAGPIASFRERARKENATDQKPKAQTKGKKGKKRGRKQQRAAQQQQQQ